MTTRGRRSQNDPMRLKEEARLDESFEAEDEGDDVSHKRRRPWKEESRRTDRESKKQRRTPEWND